MTPPLPERLRELAARCEQATGPNRNIDAVIARALGLPHGRETGWCNSENGDYWVVDECAQPFTASLDSAMTLVPEGCITTIGGGLGIGTAAVEIGGEIIGLKAATPALALCAAALRARAQSPLGDSEG